MKQNLKARIITGAILLSALAFAIIMGGWVFSVICILCIGIALYEMMHALRQRGHQIVRWPVWAATIASIPCFLMWQNRLLLPIAVFTCMVTTAYVLFHGEPKLEDILLSLMPFFAVSLPGMCLLAQINAPFRWLQVMLLCLSFLVPTLGDTAAYFVGSRFGKRKLIPAVSPNGGRRGGGADWQHADSADHLWHDPDLYARGGRIADALDLAFCHYRFCRRHCGRAGRSVCLAG